MAPRRYSILTSGVALARFAPSGGKINPLGYVAYRLGCHGLTYMYTYLDELFLKLEYTGIGCFWNSHYSGALANADDNSSFGLCLTHPSCYL